MTRQGGTNPSDSRRDVEEFLQRLVTDMNLADGKLRIFLHENDLAVVKINASYKLTFDRAGLSSDSRCLGGIRPEAAAHVANSPFLQSLRQAVGRFGCCVVKAERGRLESWEFRSLHKRMRDLNRRRLEKTGDITA